MHLFSRNSRQSTPDVQPPLSESPEQIGAQTSNGSEDEEPPSSSSKSPGRVSKEESEGYYPSFLPRRPPAPAPASTMTSVGIPEPGPSTSEQGGYGFGGRKPTPRSVRIVSLESYAAERNQRQEPTDQTKIGTPSPRAFSKATGSGFSPTVFGDALSRVPQPRFRARGLHLELLRSPSPLSWLHFLIWPFIVLAHIPVQTFFDFNAVFIMLQVAKFPNPQAPGVAGSGKNWILGTVAYVACWIFWIFGVFIGYELIYSFARRWRIKRPLMVPIYTSTPAFNYTCMSSYTKFCFFQHIRKNAWSEDRGGLKDGLAETFWWYGQNLPTVALLLPRAGLCLALLLQFSTAQAGAVALGASGRSQRDSTYFHKSDGTLTDYAFGILVVNAAWTAWRFLVLFTSWVGLWILSGQGCAGLCGPRDRWEEDEGEKTLSVYTDNLSDLDALPWSWRECTRMRIQEAHDFCSTQRRVSDISESSAFMPPPLAGSRIESGQFEGMDQLLAAVGLPTSPAPARRGILSQDLFRPSIEHPRTDTPPELATIIPKVIQETSRELAQDPNTPLMRLPYPFTMPSARASSEDHRIPFPPSPGQSEENEHATSSGSRSASGHDENLELEIEEIEEEYDADPSSGRASGSMSSLGHPVTSRYPFQFRRPARGVSMSSAAHSRQTPSSNSKSLQSRISQATQSTGNRESTDSQSPRSHRTSSSVDAGIPMPPRHPNPSQNRGRPRAGTVPQSPSMSSSSSHAPVAFPSGLAGRPSIGTTSTGAMSSSEALPIPEGHDELSYEEEDQPQMMEQPDADSDDSHEAAEREDQVALLAPSASVSPKSSRSGLRQRASTLSFGQRRRNGSASNSSSSRSRTGSSASGGVRSRTQSLIHSVGAASRSSLELVQTAVRSRAQSSIARLSEEGRDSSDGKTHSRSGSNSTNPENHTFGVPLHPQPPVQEEPEPSSASPGGSPSLPPPSTPNLQTPASEVASFVSAAETLEAPPPPDLSRQIPNVESTDSIADYVSTARDSMITESATMEGTSSSGHTVSVW
ncbi:hypothetical protein DL96DRAFT_1791019, partial [Flagelloscypha sp. PMI_526]